MERKKIVKHFVYLHCIFQVFRYKMEWYICDENILLYSSYYDIVYFFLKFLCNKCKNYTYYCCFYSIKKNRLHALFIFSILVEKPLKLWKFKGTNILFLFNFLFTNGCIFSMVDKKKKFLMYFGFFLISLFIKLISCLKQQKEKH